MDDLPAAGEFFENQAEVSLHQILLGIGQVPLAQHEGGIIGNGLKFKVIKSEVAHLVAGVIASDVAVVGRLPAPGQAASAGEGQIGRIPVTGHELPDISLIPSLNLLLQHGLDGFFFARM